MEIPTAAPTFTFMYRHQYAFELLVNNAASTSTRSANNSWYNSIRIQCTGNIIGKI